MSKTTVNSQGAIISSKVNGYLKVINSNEPLRESFITVLKNFIQDRHNFKGTSEERSLIYESLEDIERDITDEQTAKGLEWIKVRAAKRTNPFNEEQTGIINNFQKFTFLGFEELGNSRHLCWYFVPVYKVIDKSGNYFTYYYDMSTNSLVINP